jgi:hypothetical protein
VPFTSAAVSQKIAYPGFLEWVSPLNLSWLFSPPAWLLFTRLSSASWPHGACPFYSKKLMVISLSQLVSIRLLSGSWWMILQVMFCLARLFLTQNNMLCTALII